jgi:hypothetical protein
MFRIILREIVILILSLAVFPATVILLLVYNDPLNLGPVYFAQELLLGGMGAGGASLTLWIKFLSPYLVLQAIRGLFWSQRSLAGRRWANLYFALLAATWAGVSLWRVWDLFYFMYELGDMPAQLIQLFQLEGTDMLIAVGCGILAAYCFSIFLDPRRKQKRSNPGAN